MLLFT